ncbi:MAG: hypothetical protein ACOCRO_03195 [Halanaerobiales bacterium]
MGKSLITHVNMVHGVSLSEYMNKFNLTKKDVHHHSYLDGISERVKGDNNPGYNHGGKYSPFSKKFIKYKSKSNNEKERLVKDKFKSRKLRSPENNPCKMEYYLKFTNGNKKEANKLYKEKQATFSLKKCIEKYGEKEGHKR